MHKSVLHTYIQVISSQNSLLLNHLGYEVIDLNTTGAAFAQETLAWSATRLYKGTMLSYVCADTVLLGGWQILGQPGQSQKIDYFQRVYTNLPPHTMIRFTMTVWAIDSWDGGSNDGFYLTFDQTIVDGLHIHYGYHPEQICGIMTYGWTELRNIRVMGTVAHSAPSLVFKVNAYFDEDSNNESVGFRDINFAFVQANTTVPSLCGIAGSYFPGQCSCPEGQFLNTVNGVTSCNKCHKSCSSCFGPTEAHCYSCKKPGYGSDGNKCVACTGAGSSAGGTCFTCNGANPGVCLPCAQGQIYYPEIGACRDYCDYPLSRTTTTFGDTCLFPCQSGQYVSENQTCTTTCPAPSQRVLLDSYYKLCLN